MGVWSALSVLTQKKRNESRRRTQRRHKARRRTQRRHKARRRTPRRHIRSELERIERSRFQYTSLGLMKSERI
jgi:hypothetical protein